MRRVLTTAALALAGLVAAALPASAHVTVQPSTAQQGGYATLNFKVPNERVKQGVAKARERMEGRPRTAGLVLFSSSVIGVPPLYVVSIACGTIGMRLIPFFLIGTVGRLIHFAAVAMIPEVARKIIG